MMQIRPRAFDCIKWGSLLSEILLSGVHCTRIHSSDGLVTAHSAKRNRTTLSGHKNAAENAGACAYPEDTSSPNVYVPSWQCALMIQC